MLTLRKIYAWFLIALLAGFVHAGLSDVLGLSGPVYWISLSLLGLAIFLSMFWYERRHRITIRW